MSGAMMPWKKETANRHFLSYAMGDYRDRRVEAGKIKADQIRETGARIVATPCHNCIDQLMELNQVYELGVEIKTVAELVADALVLEAPRPEGI